MTQHSHPSAAGGEAPRIWLIILVTLAAIAGGAAWGTLVAGPGASRNYLPRTATEIIDHGNGWYEFTLNAERWIFHTDGQLKESVNVFPERRGNSPKIQKTKTSYNSLENRLY